MERKEVGFESGGERCAAWLYPSPPAATSPAIVMAHGLTGTRRDRLGAFAKRFAQAGIAALVFDHRGFGDSEGEPDLFEPRRQLEDWAAAIAHVRSLDGVDPARVATFGSSMGGGNALAAAAADPEVAAAVSQVPFLTMRQAHRSPLRVQARMIAAAIRGRHLPALGQPGDAAFINAPGGKAGWQHVVAIGEDSRWRDRASSRWLLASPFTFNYVRHARRLHCPWLVCVGEADRVAAPGIAIRAARRAPLGELRTYPGVDHFDIYDGPEHEAVVADEIEFLQRHLQVSPDSSWCSAYRATLLWWPLPIRFHFVLVLMVGVLWRTLPVSGGLPEPRLLARRLPRRPSASGGGRGSPRRLRSSRTIPSTARSAIA